MNNKMMMIKLLGLAACAVSLNVAQAADLANGEAIVKKLACVACHGEGMNKPIDPSYPKIAGQYEDYLFNALKAYKTENNKLVGRNNPSMVGFAKQMSLKEMRDVAAYVAQLPGELKVAPEPKFRTAEK